MKTLAETFRARRIARALTQEQAAQAAGLARRTVVAFETGDGGIRLVNLRRLLAVVGLELATREAGPRPTLDELAARYSEEEEASPRKRARRGKAK